MFCIRPQPLLLQLITSDISLKRLARVGVGVACIVGALIVNDIDWTAGRAGMLALALIRPPALCRTLRQRGRGAVCARQRRRVHQRLYLRRPVCRYSAGLSVATVARGRLRLSRPGGVHRVPTRAGHPRVARWWVLARLARLVPPTCRGLVLARGNDVVALRSSALSGGRRMNAIIATQGLTREFQVRRRGALRARSTVTAVDDLTVEIGAGAAVGYIGANGAGKSTTIKMLTGILVPTRGTVQTCGREPMRERRQLAAEVGVVFGQRSQLWWDLPLRESFELLAAIHRCRSPKHGLGQRNSSTIWIWARPSIPRYASCPSANACAGRSPPPCCIPHPAHPRRADDRARCVE